jgi:hypothetical protein
LVVNTQNWLPGKSVLVSPQWVKGVSWAKRKVHLDLEQGVIEVRLYDYYGRPRYWTRM